MSWLPGDIVKRHPELMNLVKPLVSLTDATSPQKTPRTPTRELIVWRNHQVKMMLETEREKDRFERSEREKQLKKQKDTPTDSVKADRKQNSSSRLSEVKIKRAREISELAAKVELTAREHEAHVKNLQQQRNCESQQRALTNRSRLTEVQQCRSQMLQAEDTVRSQQLEEMQRKLNRSREAHSVVLHTRAQSAVRKRQKPASFSPGKQVPDDTSRLISYVQKMQSASRKHTMAKQQEVTHREAQRKAKEQHLKRVAMNLQSHREKIAQWTKSVENRHYSVNISRTSDHARTVDRERDEFRLVHREKMAQMRASRQAELMGKWTDVEKRVDALKKRRALSVERHRDKLHFDMMEKEKTYRVLEEVARSPQSRRAQQLLKDLGHTG